VTTSTEEKGWLHKENEKKIKIKKWLNGHFNGAEGRRPHPEEERGWTPLLGGYCSTTYIYLFNLFISNKSPSTLEKIACIFSKYSYKKV
jgi:hypothetical protein